MNIDTVIAQIRALCPIFANNVAGAANYASGVRDQVWLPLPAAYVLHLPEEAEENTSANGLWQIIHERIAVIAVLDTMNIGGTLDIADRRGQACAAYLDTVRAGLFRAILNWRPDFDPANPATNREARGIYYVGAEFPADGAFDRARFFYQFTFGLDTLVTEIDGWQLPYAPLVDIRGTITVAPGTAELQFDVPVKP